MSITRNAASLGFASFVAVVCALQAGCIPYAYPNLTSVPAVRLDPTPEPIHAFRVEVKGHKAGFSSSTDDYALSGIDWSSGDRLPAQSDVSFEYGGQPLIGLPIHHGKTLLVRLYRPGYQLVELRAGDEAKVEWMPAVGFAAKECAIDGLLAEPAYTSNEATRQRTGVNRSGPTAEVATSAPEKLPPGSRSAKHHDALLFAAAEYERLAATPTIAEDDAARLRKKAAAVRACAGQ